MGPDALLRQKSNAQKRFREGYAEGATTLYTPLPAAAFIVSETPVELLGQHSRYEHEVVVWPCEAAAGDYSWSIGESAAGAYAHRN